MRSVLRLSVFAGALFCLALEAPEAAAQAKPKPGAHAPKTQKPKAKPKKPAKAEKSSASEKSAAEENAGASDETATPASTESPKPAGEGESGLKAAGTTATPEQAGAVKGQVTEKSGAEGVKTYKFGAIEVEGRLRAPQVIYFLRRVRAEFDAGALGHRSFLRELKGTRHDASFR